MASTRKARRRTAPARTKADAAPAPHGFWQSSEWSLLITLLVALLIIFFIAELAGMLDARMLAIFAAIEVMTLIILLLDLYFKFTHTPSKTQFLRQNWLTILLLLPASAFAVSLRFAGSTARSLGILGEASGVAAGDLRLGTVSMSMFAKGMQFDVFIARAQKLVGSLTDATSLASRVLRRVRR